MTDDAAREELRRLQAEAEGIPPARSVRFRDRQFRMSEQPAAMALMKFAAVADAGISTADMRALAALYRLLEKTLHPGVPFCGECEACRGGEGQCPARQASDWQAFEQLALDTDATADELLDVVQQIYAVLTGRPTGRPSASSDGRPPTSVNSTGSSSPAPDPALSGSTPASSPT